ncbi:DUF1285 domain-containing protein [Alteromonas sp. C1M14]|uniref:DUF1285 domain-containing protein n=1 Tax=Alteromonas sp. C1M14 TaxID=2841567 RepID=UPI001C08A53B|nr:DUF1285 domain-containing protein [Alteromonas sp. C1M14]MBU2978402.1 DUF1285 domain-containing protein [Alteromonas sp. C1M14]
MDFKHLQDSITACSQVKEHAIPPVEQWDPPFCGKINLRISLKGEWFYEGSPILRPGLVTLFSSVLKKEANQYFLVTPVEKVGIEVEDVPFIITTWHKEDNGLLFTTQAGDVFPVNEAHPVELSTPPPNLGLTTSPIPYVKVCRNLWARLHQNVLYQLINDAEIISQDDGKQRAIVKSKDYPLVLGEIDEQG